MATKKTVPAQEVETPENEEAQTEPQISFNQMIAVKDIIDLCSKRGAFQGEELELVGQIRNAFAGFVDFHAPKEETPPATPNTETSDVSSA